MSPRNVQRLHPLDVDQYLHPLKGKSNKATEPVSFPTNGPGVEEQSERGFRELVLHLMNNYVDVSLDSGVHHSAEELRRVTTPVFARPTANGDSGSVSPGNTSYYRSTEAYPRRRNILVVGAGLSYAAYGDMAPLALHAVKRLHDDLGVSGVQRLLGREDPILGSDDPIELKREWFQRVQRMENIDQDFETQLSILSTVFSRRRLRNAISDIYNHRFYPHISFEIIAHLFNHRFIDVIVDFNFDEMLDQAISEEIGQQGYLRVISDGDCVNLTDVTIDGRLKVPVYMKPHGTVGHKSTLRFTKDDYFGMPYDMQVFLRKLVEGRLSDDQTTTGSVLSNIITVGFGVNSLDLISMLRHHSERLAVEQSYSRHHRMNMFHLNVCSAYRRFPTSDEETSENESGSENTLYFDELAASIQRQVPNATHYFINVSKPPAYEDAAQNGIFDSSIDQPLHMPPGARDKPGASGEAVETEDDRQDSPVYPFLNTATSDGDDDEWPTRTANFTNVGDCFRALFKHTSNAFAKGFQPRHIARHELIHTLFFQPDNDASSGAGTGKREPNEDSYFLERLYVEVAIALARSNGRLDLSPDANQRLGLYYEEVRKRFEQRANFSSHPGTVRAIREQFGLAPIDGYSGTVLTMPATTHAEEEDWLSKPIADLFPDGYVDRTKDAYGKVEQDPDVSAVLNDVRAWRGLHQRGGSVQDAAEQGPENEISDDLPPEGAPASDDMSQDVAEPREGALSEQIDDVHPPADTESDESQPVPADNFLRQLLQVGPDGAEKTLLNAVLPIVTALFEFLAENRGRKALLEQIDREERKKVLKAFVDLYGSDANDIAPHFGYKHLLPFDRPLRRSVLHTNLGLTMRFADMVQQRQRPSHPEGWNLMLGISENGKIIEKMIQYLDRIDPLAMEAGDDGEAPAFRTYLKSGCASVVVARPPRADVLNNRIASTKETLIPLRFGQPGMNETLDMYAPELPFWVHNHHMVVFVRVEETPSEEGGAAVNDATSSYRMTPLGGISLRKEGIKNKISPIYLDDSPEMRDDLDVLVSTYFAYVMKAATYAYHGTLLDVTSAHANLDAPGDPSAEGFQAIHDYIAQKVIAQRDAMFEAFCRDDATFSSGTSPSMTLMVKGDSVELTSDRVPTNALATGERGQTTVYLSTDETGRETSDT